MINYNVILRTVFRMVFGHCDKKNPYRIDHTTSQVLGSGTDG